MATTAVEWMELHAIKAGKRPPDEGFVSAIWQQLLSDAKTLEDSKKYNINFPRSINEFSSGYPTATNT